MHQLIIVFNESAKRRDDALCQLLIINCSLIIRVLVQKLILVDRIVRHVEALQSDKLELLIDRCLLSEIESGPTQIKLLQSVAVFMEEGRQQVDVT